ncbi:MAG: type II toxin-antitoxin system YoeB family toxin [Crocosphaera sp.]|nr:type II toxin-antitoxin system YoeB family toxin [Crocosphaera sp.]
MKLTFAEKAWEDYLYWQQTDKKILKRINTFKYYCYFLT